MTHNETIPQEAARKYENKELTIEQIASTYKIARKTALSWISRGKASKIRRKRTHRTYETKKEIAELYLNSDKSAKQIADSYGVGAHSVEIWAGQYLDGTLEQDSKTAHHKGVRYSRYGRLMDEAFYKEVADHYYSLFPNSLTKTARHFGVSDSAVFRWAKTYANGRVPSRAYVPLAKAPQPLPAPLSPTMESMVARISTLEQEIKGNKAYIDALKTEVGDFFAILGTAFCNRKHEETHDNT